MNEESHKTKSFMKRNQPSFSWYSNSYPATSQLQQFARPPSQNQMSTSCILDGASSSVASTVAARNTVTSERPLTAKSKSDEGTTLYNYEGGLFFEPKKHADFFVIHPDWVSEAMSIQKLTLSNRNVTKTLTWPGRRCKSAPPPKLRNPITWDQKV
ncbi:hypothetical protein CHS0354_018959 [Potamilus streckersoni]|uniref:Uncharacterized protein n=1 Tax=Potamilus streckersoni TaxID=2493646 RepID=A0AAE0T6M5_9BIVA|nr:hypothetical protein CHS0354_018959 [Potamilus streckersoni]